MSQGAEKRRESKAKWRAVPITAKWLGVGALHDLSTQLQSGLQLAWVWLPGEALLRFRLTDMLVSVGASLSSPRE